MDVASAPAGSVVAPTKLRVPDGDGALAPVQASPTARLALVDAHAARAVAAHDGRGPAWLTLDPEDADPVRLWRGIIAALRTLAPGFGTDAERILAAGPAVLAGAVVPLVAAEAARFLDPPLLVLDRFA